MRLDYDLIRDLLLYVEENTDGVKTIYIDDVCQDFPNVPEIKCKYHIKYLKDDYLIQLLRDVHIIDITPKGREYLNNIRDKSIWDKTKNIYKPLGSVTLSVVSEIGKSLILQRLGL